MGLSDYLTLASLLGWLVVSCVLLHVFYGERLARIRRWAKRRGSSAPLSRQAAVPEPPRRDVRITAAMGTAVIGTTRSIVRRTAVAVVVSFLAGIGAGMVLGGLLAALDFSKATFGTAAYKAVTFAVGAVAVIVPFVVFPFLRRHFVLRGGALGRSTE